MAERTTAEVAQIFSAAGDSVTVINAEVAKSSLDAEETDRLKRNVEHLETIKAYKKEDGTTSIWTSESFTAINSAITAGNTKLSG
jgi:hypothetical protein